MGNCRSIAALPALSQSNSCADHGCLFTTIIHRRHWRQTRRQTQAIFRSLKFSRYCSPVCIHADVYSFLTTVFASRLSGSAQYLATLTHMRTRALKRKYTVAEILEKTPTLV